MKLYRISNWSEIFENNRSREIKKLSWVAVPNHHDGEHFSAIMQHPKGAIIYAAWMLIVQVASRCTPRGTLVRHGGTLLRDCRTPLTPESLSLKTRAPVEWFQVALEYLEQHTDWIESEEIPQEGAAIPQPSAVTPQEGAPRARAQDRTEQDGKDRTERKGKEPAPLAEIVFPESFKAPEFQSAWSDWVIDRKTRKKPITPLAAKEQLQFLEKLGVEDAIKSIKASIAGGWQGLFEPKGQHATNQRNHIQTPAERRNSQIYE